MWALAICISFWAVSFLLDVTITVSRKELVKYETNLLFRHLVQSLGVKLAVAIQAATEAVLGLAISSLIERRLDPTSLGIISVVFGTAHLLAWHSNKKFLAGYGTGQES